MPGLRSLSGWRTYQPDNPETTDGSSEGLGENMAINKDQLQILALIAEI
jgi:hypothetical protein